MSTCTVVRILGNTLPPRDTAGRRHSTLRRILEDEPKLRGARKLYVINRIYDVGDLALTINLLESHNADYRVIPFKAEADLIQINAARNFAIAYGQESAEWTVILDGDCEWTSDGWEPVIDAMLSGDVYNQTSHISIPHAREGTSILAEPMVAFHQSSSQRFNPLLLFGNAEKLDLLYRLGHNPRNITELLGDNCDTRLAGYVTHRTTGEPAVELDVNLRMRLRAESVQNLQGRVRRGDNLALDIGLSSQYFPLP